MKSIVADTSALMRLYLPDGPVPEGLEAWLQEAWNGGAVLLAPDLMLAEAGQVIWKKQKAGLIDPSEADEVLDAVLELPIELVPHRGLLAPATGLARRFDLTVYDALFLALVQQRGAELISADAEMVRAYHRVCQPDPQ